MTTTERPTTVMAGGCRLDRHLSEAGNDGPYSDVTPDGQRFFMTRVRATSNEQVVLVLTWFEELKSMNRR